MSLPLSRRWPGAAAGAALLCAATTALAATPTEDPFSSSPLLQRAELVRQVLERNPGLEASRAAWQAALAREPQVTSLDDPMLRYELAPLSIGSRTAPFGQAVELGQRLPFFGKRALAGEVARAEAEALRGDYLAARQRLALMASMLYDDLFLTYRALEVNAHHLHVLEELRRSAEAQYVAGRAAQQDPLQAQVEQGMLERERLELEAQRDTLRAQLNGLLHRAPHLPLPPPPERLEVPPEPSASPEELQAEALRRRPELAGLRARLGGGEAEVGMAHREYLPDVNVMGSYNSMWTDPEHRLMVGVSLELPLALNRRKAAVEEAQARLRGMQREQERMADEIRVEVEQARTRLREALRALALYRDRVLPAANDQLAAARAGFESGRNGFQVVLQAEQNQRGVELRLQEALAEVQRRHAELQRALGHTPGLPPQEETQP